MTKQEYQERGFRLSLQIEQEDIDRAEKAVTDAYIAPLTDDRTGELVISSIMNFAFLWLMQHSLYNTRSGAKSVNITSATTPSNEDVLRQCALDCHQCLQALREALGKNDVKVLDICRIYFTTNYLGL
jgi:hypothetical protein